MRRTASRRDRIIFRVVGRRRLVPSLLQTPNFRSFWIGETISVVGDQLTLLAMPLVAILVLDADARDMGTLTAVSLLPHLLFSLPAGVWLERVQVRKRVMIWGPSAVTTTSSSIRAAE